MTRLRGRLSRALFTSLRTKFVFVIGLIVVAVCVGLSAVFVEHQRDVMTEELREAGTLLVKDLAHTSRYAALTDDVSSLGQSLASAMADERVVYTVVTTADGRRLAAQTKGQLSESAAGRSAERPLYPDPGLASAVMSAPADSPRVALYRVEPSAGSESIYDFASAVPRPGVAAPTRPDDVLAIVQIGLSRSSFEQALGREITSMALIAVLMMLVGIAAAVLLADRIVTPLKRLATAAQRVAEGDLMTSLQPASHDEVGQLTETFARMTRFLAERDAAISAHIATITRQVRHLTALNQTAAAVSSTLDSDKLLATVLQVLIDNLGYRRMALMLYDAQLGIAHDARVAGVPKDVERAAQRLTVRCEPDGALLSDILLYGRAFLVSDTEQVAGRLHPQILELARQAGVTSFVCAPLKTPHRIVGFIAADRGESRCTSDDLELLITISTHIAIVLDNALAYRELAQMTQTLEQRVDARTRELQAANEKLLELDRLKSAFVSIVSHELRTPMTSIKGYVENMLDGLTGALNEKQAYYLGRVKYNAERLTRMINDLLDLSRIEAGRVEVMPTTMYVPELLSEILDGFHSMAREKGLHLEVRPPKEPVAVQADRDKLHQILTNLIQNALKFTPAGGEVSVSADVDRNEAVQFCVSDSGCGIPLPEQVKIFDRFYRGETVNMDQRGAGLGLAITKSLVELHGGRIWVESAPGQGSRFYFTMPKVSRET